LSIGIAWLFVVLAMLVVVEGRRGTRETKTGLPQWRVPENALEPHLNSVSVKT
jgi:hypothetical protein